MSHLVYTPGTPAAAAFPSIRYPWRHEISRDEAEEMRSRMPDPDRFVVVEDE